MKVLKEERKGDLIRFEEKGKGVVQIRNFFHCKYYCRIKDTSMRCKDKENKESG